MIGNITCEQLKSYWFMRKLFMGRLFMVQVKRMTPELTNDTCTMYIIKLVGSKVYGEIFTDFSHDFDRKLIWFISGIYGLSI